MFLPSKKKGSLRAQILRLVDDKGVPPGGSVPKVLSGRRRTKPKGLSEISMSEGLRQVLLNLSKWHLG